MSDRTYWLSLFNPTTWQEFLNTGAEVVGFPETRQKTVRRIQPGDYLLTYLTGVSCWIAVLEVVDEPYDSIKPIWKQALFPCRVNVKAIAQVNPNDGIPALDLAPQLKMFESLKTPQWGLLFRIAPKELPPEDGAIITDAIQKAVQ